MKNLIKYGVITLPEVIPFPEKGYVINQYVIVCGDMTIFQSYESIIAIKTPTKTILGKNWDFSKTTGKYRNLFLREKKNETLRKIKNGEYIVDESL